MNQIFTFHTDEATTGLWPEGKAGREKQIKESLWQCFMAAALLYGLLRAFRAAVPGSITMLCLLAGAGALCGCAVIFGCTRRVAAELLPAGAAALLFVVAAGRVLPGGVLALNVMIARWNTAHEDGQALLQVAEVPGALPLVGLFFTLLAAAAAWWITRNGSAATGCLLALAVTAAALLLDCADVPATAALLVGVFCLWCTALCGVPSRRLLGWILGGTALLCVAGLLQPGQPHEAIDNFRTVCADMVDTLRYGSDTLPEGDLHHAAEMLGDDTERLTVHSDQIKNLYLRGFVGAECVAGVWEPLPGADYGGQETGMLDWLDQNDAAPTRQYGRYAALDGSDEKNVVTVTNTGAVRKYLYAPYSALQVTDFTQERDNTLLTKGFFGSKNYRYTECGQNMPSELLYASAWVSEPQSEAQQGYAQAEAVYRTFVYGHYLTMDPESEEAVKTLFLPTEGSEANGTESIYDVTDRIRKVLRQRVSYNAAPAELPEGEDPILWFLASAREGNAALYASTAVYAFRACGIPARYVEGYLVSDTVLQASADGSVQVTGRNSHAWAEVYFDGMGWMPVDVTPGYYYEEYQMKQMVEMPQGVVQTAAPSEDGQDSGGDLTGEGTAARAPEKRKTLWERLPTVVAAAVGIALLCAAFVLLILEFYRGLRRLRAAGKNADDGGEADAGALCDAVCHTLAAAGMPVTFGEDAAQVAERVEHAFPAVGKSEYARVNALMQKYYYGGLPLEAHEQRVLSTFLRHLRADTTPLPLATRLKLRYGAALAEL